MGVVELTRDKAMLSVLGAISAVVVGVVVNFLTAGGLIALLGGLTQADFANVAETSIKVRCQENFDKVRLGRKDLTFCALTDVSILDDQADGGWRVCRIDTDADGMRYLVADMHGATCSNPLTGGVFCKAQCIQRR